AAVRIVLPMSVVRGIGAGSGTGSDERVHRVRPLCVVSLRRDIPVGAIRAARDVAHGEAARPFGRIVLRVERAIERKGLQKRMRLERELIVLVEDTGLVSDSLAREAEADCAVRLSREVLRGQVVDVGREHDRLREVAAILDGKIIETVVANAAVGRPLSVGSGSCIGEDDERFMACTGELPRLNREGNLYKAGSYRRPRPFRAVGGEAGLIAAIHGDRRRRIQIAELPVGFPFASCCRTRNVTVLPRVKVTGSGRTVPPTTASIAALYTKT